MNATTAGQEPLREQSKGFPSAATTLVSIIVTHFNYSAHVAAALASVTRQTHTHFECIIVDDRSDSHHVAALRRIVSELNDSRFSVIELPVNKGQINAVFEGLAASKGEFVSLLDPDDLYDPFFVERMLNCHLNPVVFASVATCEMGLFRVGGQVLTRAYVGYKYEALKSGNLARAEASLADFGFTAYYPPEDTGWFWATTSSMMFRRDALTFLKRQEFLRDQKFFADAYCAYGAHLIGGTLMIDEVLSWRGLHDSNTAESEYVVSLHQHRHRPEFVDATKEVKLFAADSLLLNGGSRMFRKGRLRKTLTSQFSPDEITVLVRKHPFLAETMMETPPSLPSPQENSPA